MKISKIALVSVTATVMSLSLFSCTHTNKSASSKENSHSEADDSSVKLHTVYFDFDKSNIRASEREKVEAMAHSLKDHPNTKVQVQGNTDDRGSVEYNMALGTKRAEALKKHLVTSGVNPDNVDTVSYGKERPVVQGSDEGSWAQNRRGDVVAVGE